MTKAGSLIGSGSIYQMPDGRWKAEQRYRDHKGRRKTVSRIARRKKEAREALFELRKRAVEVMERKAAAPSPHTDMEERTLEEQIEHWLQQKLQRRRHRATTSANYRYNAQRHIFTHPVASVRCGDLSRDQVLGLLVTLRDGELAEKPDQLRKIRQILHAACKDLRKLGRGNPADIDMDDELDVPPSKRKQHFFEPSEVLLIQASFDNPDSGHAPDFNFAALVAVAADTGARIGELLALSWQHVDLESQRIEIVGSLAEVPGDGLVIHPPKTSAGTRTIAITDELSARLKRLRGTRFGRSVPIDVGGRPVFVNRFGKRMRPTNARDKLGKRLRILGIDERKKWHSFRHLAATVLLKATEERDSQLSEKDVATTLGHSNASITRQIYAKSLAGHEARSRDVMAKALAKARKDGS